LDSLSANDNFRRLSKMLAQATYDEMKEKLQVLNDLYTSRHYTQCAKFGERLLDETNDKVCEHNACVSSRRQARSPRTARPNTQQTHPIHLAYLNFYTALSHDTLAREATLKNRFKELNAAEKFYSVAITVLTPTSPASAPSSDDEQPPTPTSPGGQRERAWRRRSARPGSFDSSTSYRSSTSSTASYAFDLEQDPDLALKNFRFPAPPDRDLGGNLTFVANDGTRHIKMDSLLSPLSTPQPPPLPPQPRTPEEFQLPTGTSAFVGMLEGHLASVRDLREKTGVQGVRFAFPTPEPSPIKLKLRSSRTSQMLSDEDRENLRQKRRKMTWRPRFDPTSVQKLCSEALAELS
jgi:hypothetical protein